MKSIFKRTILAMAALFVAAVNIKATVFTNLYNFGTLNFNNSIFINPYTNNSGAFPYAGLVLSSNILYGATYQGGTGGNGTIFKINTDGTGFTNLHSFSTLTIIVTNYDGAESYANLVLSSNTLYGTASRGGLEGSGTIFKINTDGTGFTNLYSFSALVSGTNSDGASVLSGLVPLNNVLYGTAPVGGRMGNGTIFKINTDGTGFTNLYSFSALVSGTNSDGADPFSKLELSGNSLYGTASVGGIAGNGTIFKINTDGTGFTNLYSFSALISNTNSDGANPQSGLTLAGNIFYGVTQNGGSGGKGTVFKINTDGTQFTNLYNFTAINNNTNSDGAGPVGELALSGNTLYGTTQLGGNGGEGTMFKINADGTGFTNLYSFSTITSNTNSDGANPSTFFVISGNTLYGTAPGGGTGGSGTLFALNLPLPNLNIQLIGSAAILSWNDPIFSLQAAPAVLGVYTNVPGATSPFTNAITRSQQFFRLNAN
jgi:uncharacterized repeat protein (TIGR03803 family)